MNERTLAERLLAIRYRRQRTLDSIEMGLLDASERCYNVEEKFRQLRSELFELKHVAERERETEEKLRELRSDLYELKQAAKRERKAVA